MSSNSRPSEKVKRTVDAFLAERGESCANPSKNSPIRAALLVTADRMLKGGRTPQAIHDGLALFEKRQHREMPSAFQPLLLQLCEFIKNQGGKS